MKKKEISVLVLAGGLSSEREISLRSGKNCFEALQRLGYPVNYLDLQSKESVQSLVAARPDITFLMTHGTYGEDGALQGMLDWLGYRYTGSGRTASAICMDKFVSKLILREHGLPVSEGLMWSEDLHHEELLAQWHCQSLFAKPRHGGSSVDTCIVKNAADFRRLKPHHMVEPYIKGKEVTVGYIQDASGWTCLPMLELRPKNEYYDFEAKYTKGLTDFILPAELTALEHKALKKFGEEALKAAGVAGFGRVDFLVQKDRVVILEINTLPGMTNTSDLPAQAAEAGISYDELVEKILLSALLKKEGES